MHLVGVHFGDASFLPVTIIIVELTIIIWYDRKGEHDKHLWRLLLTNFITGFHSNGSVKSRSDRFKWDPLVIEHKK